MRAAKIGDGLSKTAFLGEQLGYVDQGVRTYAQSWFSAGLASARNRAWRVGIPVDFSNTDTAGLPSRGQLGIVFVKIILNWFILFSVTPTFSHWRGDRCRRPFSRRLARMAARQAMNSASLRCLLSSEWLTPRVSGRPVTGATEIPPPW